MRVVFLEMDHEREWAVASIGPAFIASYLRQHGHEVSLLRIPLDEPVDAAVSRIVAAGAGLIGVSLTSRQWLRGRDIVGALREVSDTPVIAGGLHPTFSADTVLSAHGFDYCCLGEGEEPMLDLVNALEAGREQPVRGIANIQVRGEAAPPLRPPFSPIDELPFMARDMLGEQYGVVHMATQRGCPYPCTYCAARQFSDLYGSYADYGRRRSLDNVIAELAALRDSDNLNYVIFLDDTFTINHRWVHDFCRVYGKEFGVPFSLHARVETVSESMLHELAAAGCRHIAYGVESGSERVRREIMHRHAPNDRFVDVFRWTREAGIITTANYILATPGETAAEIEQTLALHDALKPDDFGYFVFYPYPGTALYHLCNERGYLPPDFDERPANHRRSVLNLPDLSPDEVEHFYGEFTARRERDHLKRIGEQQPEAYDVDETTRSFVDAVQTSAELG
ncbi:MAG: radical SAM protein [Pseudomonadota bacterium]